MTVQTKLGIVAIIVLAALVAGLSLAVLTANDRGPLASEPATCREFVGRIQQRGLDVKWVERNGLHSGVFVFKSSSKAFVGNAYYVEGYAQISDKNLVTVIQYPEARTAAEQAGRKPEAFAFGRFCISGDAELVKAIRSKL